MFRGSGRGCLRRGESDEETGAVIVEIAPDLAPSETVEVIEDEVGGRSSIAPPVRLLL